MTTSALEARTSALRSDDVRYGCYLRPSFAMCRAQAGLHALLARQYNLHAAGRFMPHATLKGFFRSEAPVPTIISALDRALAGVVPFTVVNNGPIPFGRGSVVIDVHNDERGAPNEELRALHETVFEALALLVHPACEFTPGEPARASFFAHLTLVMADMPEWLFDEVFAFIQEAEPFGPRRFPAAVVQLVAFESADWSGDWWETLTWEILHSWTLR